MECFNEYVTFLGCFFYPINKKIKVFSQTKNSTAECDAVKVKLFYHAYSGVFFSISTTSPVRTATTAKVDTGILVTRSIASL